MTKRHQLAIVTLMLLSTLLWGTAVAAHQHWDGEVEHCEFSLLPHAADVATATDVNQITDPDVRVTTWSDNSHRSPITPPYQGRAPPLAF